MISNAARIIEQLIANGPMTTPELSQLLGIGHSSIGGCLKRYVHARKISMEKVYVPGILSKVNKYTLLDSPGMPARPRVVPKYDPQDPFGLYAKLHASNP